MAKLSSNLSDESVRPYFLWDEEKTVGDFRKELQDGTQEEWARRIGKLMREARDSDVWLFVTPEQVWEKWDSLKPYLGRRLDFWEYLLNGWHHDGYLP